MEKNCWIYSLHDPDTGELRYIGETKLTPNERLEGHLWKQSSEVMADWINELKLNDKKPIQKIMLQCECHRRHALEEAYIKQHASERLLNTKHNPFRDNGMKYDEKVLVLERRIKTLENDGYEKLKEQYNKTRKELNNVIDERDKWQDKYNTLKNKYNEMAEYANTQMKQMSDEIKHLKWLEKLYPGRKK